MNDFQQKLYNELMKLCEIGDDAFYFKDHKILETSGFRVFNYRLASYTDFQKPSALQCRGIMFEMDIVTGQPIRLACMMPEKFFNLNENPFTMDMVFNDDTVDEIMFKEDGSIISTYMLGKELALKSKTSVSSMHCTEAMAWLKKEWNSELYNALAIVTMQGYSVHMEFVSPMPDLKIVVAYPTSDLIIHSIRNTANGDYVDSPVAEFGAIVGSILESKWVRTVLVKDGNVQSFVNSIKDYENIEGFIIRMMTGQKVKIKTDWYNARHHAKFGIKSLRHLFEYFIDEQLDDIKAMLFDDELMIGIIANVEETVRPLYNKMIAGVEAFYEANKELDRKTYAIKAKDEVPQWHGLVMSIYLGKDPDYAKYAKNNPELFGIDPKATIGSMYIEE